jgi:hypothetical protein
MPPTQPDYAYRNRTKLVGTLLGARYLNRALEVGSSRHSFYTLLCYGNFPCCCIFKCWPYHCQFSSTEKYMLLTQTALVAEHATDDTNLPIYPISPVSTNGVTSVSRAHVLPDLADLSSNQHTLITSPFN